MPFPKHSSDQKQLFLDALARSGILTSACRVADVSRASVHRWRKEDPEFSEAYDDAMAEAADLLEEEARRRAYEGVATVKIIGTGENAEKIVESKYSDTLMLALLKAKKPDEFAERSKAEISNPDGSLRTENPETAAVRLAAILDEAKRRREAQGEPPGEADDLFA